VFGGRPSQSHVACQWPTQSLLVRHDADRSPAEALDAGAPANRTSVATVVEGRGPVPHFHWSMNLHISRFRRGEMACADIRTAIPGRAFVVKGDVTTIACDAWLCPTDRVFSVNHNPKTDSGRVAWHTNGMNRIRLSTTVDAELLASARSVRSGMTDAALIDEALGALLARYRSAEIDAAYAAYDERPADEPDEWGDLASWRRAAGAS
jgi:hypothetical protein